MVVLCRDHSVVWCVESRIRPQLPFTPKFESQGELKSQIRVVSFTGVGLGLTVSFSGRVIVK